MNEIPALEEPAIIFAEKCDRGILRQENNDSVLHLRIPLGDLMVVADGVGGYIGRSTASQMVVESFREHLAALPSDYPADKALQRLPSSPMRSC